MDELFFHGPIADAIIRRLPLKQRLRLRLVNKDFNEEIESWFRRKNRVFDNRRYEESYMTSEQEVRLVRMSPKLDTFFIDGYFNVELPLSVWFAIQRQLIAAKEVHFEPFNASLFKRIQGIDHKLIQWRFADVKFQFERKTIQILAMLLSKCPHLERISMRFMSFERRLQPMNVDSFLDAIEPNSSIKPKITHVGHLVAESSSQLKRLLDECRNLEEINIRLSEFSAHTLSESQMSQEYGSAILYSACASIKSVMLRTHVPLTRDLMKSIGQKWPKLDRLEVDFHHPQESFRIDELLESIPSLKSLDLMGVGHLQASEGFMIDHRASMRKKTRQFGLKVLSSNAIIEGSHLVSIQECSELIEFSNH